MKWFLQGSGKILILLLVNGLIIGLLLIGLEFYLKWTDPFLELPFDSYYYRGHREYYSDLPVPSEADYTWGHQVVYNRFGFRERDFEAPKPAGLCRVMVLGDSLTWGVGLDVSERYTAVAEAELKQAFPDKKFEILNFGVSGLPTTVERDILRDYKDLVSPDLVVIGFVYNDPQPRSQGYRREREIFYQEYGPLLNLLPEALFRLRLPYTAKMIRTAVENFLVATKLIPSWEVGVQRTYEKDSEEWHDFRQALQDIKLMSDEMNLPRPIFAVLNNQIYLNYPTEMTSLDENLPVYLRWFHQAEQMAASLGFKTYNHERVLIEQVEPTAIEINQLDSHPSSQVNFVYGQKLAKAVAAYIDSGQLCPSHSNQRPQPSGDFPLTEKRLMRIRLADTVRFLGYTLSPPPAERAEKFHLHLGWQALDNIDQNYLIQLEWRGRQGYSRLQYEGQPCQGACPTRQWPAGMIAPPEASTLYWPWSAQFLPLPRETILNQSHLSAQDSNSRSAIKIVPLSLALVPQRSALVDNYEVVLDETWPSDEYGLVLRLYNPPAGPTLPAYDEVLGQELPGGEIILGKVNLP